MNAHQDSIDDAMMEEAIKTMAVVQRLKPEERGSYLSACLMLSYKLMRTVAGDEFVRGWLESAAP